MLISRTALAIALGALAAWPAGAQRLDPALFAPLKWRMIGPYRGGRTKAAAGIAARPNEFYVGATNGGVWKTDDYARTWRPIFDDQPTGSIGAIAIAPSNPAIIYVGSGEGLQRPDLSTGDGLYKSTDGGKTWRHTGQLRDGQQIPQIIVDPSNPDRLFIAVLGHPYGPNEQRGIFRSLDGGRSFEKVLYRDENTGGIDVAFDPSNANVIYAVLWESRQGPWENGVFTGPGSAIHKSSDGGATWHRIMTGIPTFEEDGLGRIGITVAPTMPNRLFATVEARRNAGLYRSDDGGEGWYLVNADPRVTNRASDFAEVKVHPKNPDIVFTGSIVTWKSTDGGKTFTGIRGAPGGDDYHRIWINPVNPEIMLLAADQGAIVTTNGGATWSTWYNQPTAQMYHVTADNAFPYRVCGGQQESGSACVSSRGNWGRVTVRDWTTVGVEEYGYVAPDPLDPDIVYGGKVSRYDRRTGQTANVGPKPVRTADYRVIRTMPILFSPADPRTLYFASNVLWKTTTGGQSWTQISPDFTRRDSLVPPNVGKYAPSPSAIARHPGVIYTIAPSPLDASRIWVGTDDGLIHLTRNGGTTWSDVTPAPLRDRSWSKVSLMDASHFDPNAAYAAINTIRLDDLRPHIYRTRDAGRTWTRIVTGIDSGATINVVRQDPKRRGLLFAGSETEVWVSLDDGERWQSLRLNMPAISIRDLIIKDDDLVVGTHGRGFWILDNITLLRQLAPGPPSAEPVLYKPALVYRVRWNSNTDTPMPPDEPTGDNPPDGAMIDYYLPAGTSGRVTLELLDAAGKRVRHFASDDAPERVDSSANIPLYWPRQPRTLAATPGMHRFIWDLHYPRPKVFTFSYPIAAVPGNTELQPLGPWVLPGTYSVRLTANGRTQSHPLTVRMDPRVKTQTAGIAQMHALSLRVTAALSDGYAAITEARAALPRLREQKRADVEQRVSLLIGAGAPAGVMTLTRAHSALVTLFDVLEDADVAPTLQTRQQVAEYVGEMRRLVAQWQSIKPRVGSAPANSSPTLDRVRALMLDSLQGAVLTFYSAGFRARAESLQTVLAAARDFFVNRLGIRSEFRLGVLDTADWSRVRSVPYGIPYATYEPIVIAMPARLEASIVAQNFVRMAPAASPPIKELLAARGLNVARAAAVMPDLIGYHEVGHVVVEAYGLTSTQRWFNELLATYAAYAFLRERYPDLAVIWSAMTRLNVEQIHPEFRSLDEFDRRYEEIPPNTYGWFQGSFQSRVQHVYDAVGIDFLPRLRAAGIVAGTTYASAADLLLRLETIVPGFSDWARRLESSR